MAVHPVGVPSFPGAVQAIKVVRRRRTCAAAGSSATPVEMIYAVTPLDHRDAHPGGWLVGCKVTG
jgi:hypothetical protein